MVLKRAVILKIYYIPNDLTSQIYKKNPPNFQKCWGQMKKYPRTILLKNFKERPSKLEKGFSQDLMKQTVGPIASSQNCIRPTCQRSNIIIKTYQGSRNVNGKWCVKFDEN